MREVIDLTAELIRFRSTADRPEEIGRCMDFADDYLRRHGLSCRRIEHGGVPSLVAFPDDRGADVVLMSHVDVVPGTDEQFVPEERGGSLFGRGSFDDKYAVALSLVLYKNLMARSRTEHSPLPPFGVLITGDEEEGGYLGARKVLGEIRTSFCIALDGGDVEQIVVKEKGMLTIRLTARGRNAHGAFPWLGRNAVEMLIDDTVKVRSLFVESGEDHWHKTCNLGIIGGGKAANQVPDEAQAVLDIRFTENDDPDRIVGEIQRLVQSEVTVTAKEPVFTGGRSKYVELLCRASPGSRTTCTHCASDARFLAAYGIDGVVWGADGEESAHAPDEHVVIRSVAALYDRLEQFMHLVSGGC